MSANLHLPNVTVQHYYSFKVLGLFNEQTFYSDDRDLSAEWWLVFSSQAKVPGKKNLFNHVFGASSLLKRGALGHLLQAMSRRDFKDWTKPLGFEGAGDTHRNYRVEMRQWFSGSALYVSLLQAITARMSKALSGQVVQIRDYTAYDDELLKAAVQMNSSTPMATPVAYHATCWHQAAASKAVNQDNLLMASRGLVRTKIADGTYTRIKFDKSKFGPEPSRATVQSSRVASKPEDYELCYPKDAELLIKQTTMSIGATLGNVTIIDPSNPDRTWNWEALVQAHNSEFNPTGAAWVPGEPVKRAAEAGGGSSGFVLPPLAELCQKVDAPDTAQLSKVVPSNPSYQLWVNGDGQLHLEALQDTELGADSQLFKISGSYLVGAPATAFMQKAGAQYVQYKLEPQSLVFLTRAPAKGSESSSGPDLPSGLLTLEAVFDVLATKRQGRVELHKHTVNHSPGSAQPMKVEVDEDCCLQVMAQTATAGKELAVDKLGSTVDLQALKGLLIVHQLQYDPQMKRLKPMYPAAVPRKACQIQAGEWFLL